MTTLIDRLSKLDGPDREVDALVTCEAGDEFFWGHRLGKNEGTVVAYFDRPNGDIGHSTYTAPRYTSSIDAAVSLANRVLPGWNGDLDIGKPIADSGKMGCRIWTPESKYHNYVGEGFNSATALLIALLRAKEASKP